MYKSRAQILLTADAQISGAVKRQKKELVIDTFEF